MYIRRTHTNNSATGERYYTYRLIESRRINGQPRQLTLLNLGRHFAVDQDHWPALCVRIDEIIRHQASLFALDFPASVELEAQRIAAQLLAKQAVPGAAQGGAKTDSDPKADSKTKEAEPPLAVTAAITDIQSVDIDTLELSRPRSVAIEHLALWSMQQLYFIPLLTELGINGIQRTAILGSIIARMAAPASERATHQWLRTHSALGELLDVDYGSLPLISLYRASDVLWKHHAVIEQRLFSRVSDLFGLSTTVTLYDLTNTLKQQGTSTYFEGEAPNNSKAKRGRSKEKRSDCPLVTLGLVLDGSGFVRSSQTFAGHGVVAMR